MMIYLIILIKILMRKAEHDLIFTGVIFKISKFKILGKNFVIEVPLSISITTFKTLKLLKLHVYN